MPIYRIVAYLQASTRTACCLLLGGAINAPRLPLATNLSQLFECLFVNFLARKLGSKILCANIVFPSFCCAKRQRPHAPSPSLPCPAALTLAEFPLRQRKLYQCASVFSGVCCFLPFFPSYLLCCVVLCCVSSLLSCFCLPLAFHCHVLAFSALICIVFAHFVVAAVFCFRGCVLQRATCTSCNRFYSIPLFFFLAISLKRKLEKWHEIFVVPRLALFFSIFTKFSNQLCHRVCNNVKSNG